jgi:hypothetical protein
VASYGNPFYPVPDTEPLAQPVSPTAIVLGSLGALDPDGYLCQVLPNGRVYDVTPVVAGPSYYSRRVFDPVKYELTLTKPSSDPNQALPSGADRECFDTASTGELRVDLKANLNGAPVSLLAHRMAFEVDDIPGSEKTWAVGNEGGKPSVVNNELTATVIFTKLPAENSSFGPKNVRVLLDGTAQDEKRFWAFYAADAYNYPGAPEPPISADLEYPEPGDAPSCWLKPPNYFFYYIQTTAGAGQSSSCCTSPFFDWRASKTIRPPNHPYRYCIEARKERAGKLIPSPGQNSGEELGYIDLFAWALRHEKRHHDTFHNWWPTPSAYNRSADTGGDYDGEGIPNGLESGLQGGPYNWEELDTYKGNGDSQPDDCERYTCITAAAWTKEDAKEEDWAYPGSNWH